MPPTHGYSSFFEIPRQQNRGPDVSIVDLVPSHHCALPKTENDIIATLCTCNARGHGNVQAHTNIEIGTFSYEDISAVYMKICTSTYKNFPLYGSHQITYYSGEMALFQTGKRFDAL